MVESSSPGLTSKQDSQTSLQWRPDMPNQSISLNLTKKGQTEPEIVYVNRANSKWKSPGEGWLGPQSGVWTEMPDGVRLMDPEGKQELAFCSKLIFDTCYTLDHDAATYKFSGGVGMWQVLGVF